MPSGHFMTGNPVTNTHKWANWLWKIKQFCRTQTKHFARLSRMNSKKARGLWGRDCRLSYVSFAIRKETCTLFSRSMETKLELKWHRIKFHDIGPCHSIGLHLSDRTSFFCTIYVGSGQTYTFSHSTFGLFVCFTRIFVVYCVRCFRSIFPSYQGVLNPMQARKSSSFKCFAQCSRPETRQP